MRFAGRPVIVAAGALGAIGASGCASGDAAAIARYRGSAPPTVQLAEAPADGMYGLFTPSDATPVAVYRLKRDERLGFLWRAGKVVAVAGTNELPCEVSVTRPQYAWRRVTR